MSDDTRRRSGAQRQRDYRRRAMCGAVLVPVEADVDLVEDLVEAGWLRRDRDTDKEAISAAIRAALADSLRE